MAQDRFARLLGALGANVRDARDHRRLTQEQLAETVGISQRHLADIEAGRKSISLRRLFLLSESLRVDIRELLTPRAVPRRNPGRPRKNPNG